MLIGNCFQSIVSYLQVRIRLPNGEHKERMFLNTSTVQSVYDYVDSLMCFNVLSYSLLSSFPRVVYGIGSRDMTLKVAGFHPRISLFVQVDDEHQSTTEGLHIIVFSYFFQFHKYKPLYLIFPLFQNNSFQLIRVNIFYFVPKCLINLKQV